LQVDVPGGDKDFFTSRYDTPNPFQFRYCSIAWHNEGLYRLAIKNGKEAKFHDEATGEWYTGHWDTKMDFEWALIPSRSNMGCPTTSHARPARQSPLRRSHQELKLTWTLATNDCFNSLHKEGTSYYISTKDVSVSCPPVPCAPGRQMLLVPPAGRTFPMASTFSAWVGGALDRTTDHLYTFCGAINTQTQESQMVFRVSNGVCTIVSHIKSKNICATSVHITQAAMVEISILGA
jgi:hypothetical protein